MDTKKKKKAGEKRLLGQILYALFGLLASRICVMGYYPFVPAFYAACCLDKKKIHRFPYRGKGGGDIKSEGFLYLPCDIFKYNGFGFSAHPYVDALLVLENGIDKGFLAAQARSGYE